MPSIPSFAPPASSPEAAPFWDHLHAGELRLPRCSSCGSWQWYPLSGNPCHPDAAVDWAKLPSNDATVYTFTRVLRPFLPDGAAPAPYTVVVVEVDGVDGPRLLTYLDAEAVRVGERGTIGLVDLGTHTVPVFRPEERSGV